MKIILLFCVALMLSISCTESHADCTCDDWIGKGGYCVDYIKSRIPAFPVPYSIQAIKSLHNEELRDISKGDVALFTVSNYWHTAYVEKVHFDRKGNPVAIDVTEMNFGELPTYEEFTARWGHMPPHEWQRARCCGVTNDYGRTEARTGIPIGSIHQVWSPPSVLDRVVSAVSDILEISL